MLRRVEGAEGCRGDGQACGSELPLPASPCRSLPAASSGLLRVRPPWRTPPRASTSFHRAKTCSGMALIGSSKKAATGIKEAEGGSRRARSPRSSWASTAGASASTPISSCSASSCPGSARWSGHQYWGMLPLHEGSAGEDRAAAGEDGGAEPDELLSSLMKLSRNEMLGRGTPKLEVDLRKGEARVEIYCASKLGQFLTTVNTLDTLGLHIYQSTSAPSAASTTSFSQTGGDASKVVCAYPDLVSWRRRWCSVVFVSGELRAPPDVRLLPHRFDHSWHRQSKQRS